MLSPALFIAAAASIGPAAAYETYAATAFGADPSGKTPSTAAVRSALAAIATAGGGTLYFGPGTYHSGPFNLTNNSVLLLDRALLASVVKTPAQFGEFSIIPPLPSYGEGRDKLPNDINGRYEAFIGAYNASNITITTNSSGIIHGRGSVSNPSLLLLRAPRPYPPVCRLAAVVGGEL